MKFFTLFIVASMSVYSMSQIAWDGTSDTPNGNLPLTGSPWSVFANGGDVTVTIQPFEFNGTPAFDNVISASTDGGATWTSVGNSYDFGTSVDLGNLNTGTEVLFKFLNGSADTFYSGTLTPLNTDSSIHTDNYNRDGMAIVDLEDLSISEYSDWNFGDGSMRVTGATAAATPEPATMTALAFGAIAFFRRRKA